MKDSFHHFPLSVRCVVRIAFLIFCHSVLPFLLPGQCSQARHRYIPVEVLGSFNNHKQNIPVFVYFHLKDTHLPYSVANLLPVLLFAMQFHIPSDTLTVIL